MPNIETQCSSCGGVETISFGSRFHLGQLIWSASHSCSGCDARLEQDSWDEIPPYYRDLELQLEGVWALQILDETYSRSTVLKVIRENTNTCLSEASKLLKHLPGPILAGTQSEMMLLEDRLSDAGITASVVPMDER